MAIEVFCDEAALAAHGRAEGLGTVFREMMALLDGAPQMETMDLVA